MSKDPTPKLDRLREMREQNFERSKAAARASIPALREKIAAVPAKKPPKKSKR